MCTTSKPNKSSTSSALHDVLILIIWLVWVRLLWLPQILADLPAGLFPLCLGLCWLFEVLAPLPIGFIFVLVGINSISSVVDSSSMVNSLFVCLECQWTWAVQKENVLWIDPIDFADDGFFCMAVMFVDFPRDQLAIANDSCYIF